MIDISPAVQQASGAGAQARGSQPSGLQSTGDPSGFMFSLGVPRKKSHRLIIIMEKSKSHTNIVHIYI